MKGEKNQVKTHFSFREAKLFLSSIFKIRNREYCLVVNKFNDTDIREETKKMKMKGKKKKKNIHRDREIGKLRTRRQEKHQQTSHRS